IYFKHHVVNKRLYVKLVFNLGIVGINSQVVLDYEVPEIYIILIISIGAFVQFAVGSATIYLYNIILFKPIIVYIVVLVKPVSNGGKSPKFAIYKMYCRFYAGNSGK